MKTAIISQYKASLKMLMDVIGTCPESLWEDSTYENAYWSIVYHTLFYTALYLSKNENEFNRWPNHIAGYNCLGHVAHDGKPIIIITVYSKAELTDYANSIFKSVEDAVNDIDANDKSGFAWLPMNKVELQLYNIRHIQHHTGQLIERLHQVGIKGINWKGMG